MTLTQLPRARALVSGLCLMTLALAGLLVALSPAVADDIGASGEAEEQDLEIGDSALYAYPLTDALPPTFTSSVPPQAVCVVQPDLCPEELRPVTDGLTGAIDTLQDTAEVSPVQPVPEGAVAVAYFGGFERYESALKFELPDIPEGDEVLSFQISFPMEQPSYDLNSPMFRDIVQSIMVAIGDSDPAVIAERLPEILSEGDAVEIDSDMIRLEACPLTEPFEPGGAPQAQHADEMPRHETEGDELGEPAVDCMLGGSGLFDEESERWVFDLAFAADAWAGGDLENHGILLSPVGVPNLAYGDPDLTTNAQISLGLDDVTVAMETAEPPPPVEGVEALDDSGLDGGLEDGPASSEDLSMDDGASFDDGGQNDGFDDGAADAPEVADGSGAEMSEEPVDGPEVAASPQIDQAEQVGFDGSTPWWVWLLVPAFAGGAYLVGNAMTAAPLSAVAGGERPGAMSRLVARASGTRPLA